MLNAHGWARGFSAHCEGGSSLSLPPPLPLSLPPPPLLPLLLPCASAADAAAVSGSELESGVGRSAKGKSSGDVTGCASPWASGVVSGTSPDEPCRFRVSYMCMELRKWYRCLVGVHGTF